MCYNRRTDLVGIVLWISSSVATSLPAQELAFPPLFLPYNYDVIVVRTLDELKNVDRSNEAGLLADDAGELRLLLAECATRQLPRIRIYAVGGDYSVADLDPILVQNLYLRELKMARIASTNGFGENTRHDFSRLKSLAIMHSALDDKVARRIAAFPALETLNLAGSEISELTLTELLKSKSIRTLILWLPNRTGESTDLAFASISEDSQIVNLRITRSESTEESSLKHVAGFRRLQALHVGGIGAEFAAVLPNLKHLRELHIGFAVTASPESQDLLLESIGSLNRLETLTLNEPAVSAKAFAKIAALPKLTSLFIPWPNGVTAGLSDEVVDLIGGITQLKSLELSGEWVNDNTILRLLRLDALENLKLASTDVSAMGLRQLSNQCRLRCLDLNLTRLTAESVQVLKTMDSLRHLRLQYATEQQLADLRKAIPECRINENVESR